MKQLKKMQMALLALSCVAVVGGVSVVATTQYVDQPMQAMADEVTGTSVDVTDSVTMTEETAYRTAYNVTAIDISLGGENLLPQDGAAAYWVNDNATKNGVDLASYVYINDVSVRSVLSENATTNTYAHSSGDLFPMNVGGQYAPISMLCDANVIKLKIMQEYANFESFTLTLKKDLAWTNSDGKTLTVTKDVVYTYENGNFVLKVERAVENINDVFSVRSTQVNTSDSVIYTIDASNNFFADTNTKWLMDNYTDLQNYVMINGKSVAQINGETDDSSYEYVDFPGSIGGVYAVPVRLNFGSENGYTRLNVYVHNSYLAENPVDSIGIKAGFSTQDETTVYTVTEDQIFYAYDNTYAKKCTVTFDGVEKTGYIGHAIPASSVPAEPVKEGNETTVYVFVGWYNGEEAWNWETRLTGDLQLTSKFEERAREYTITYYNEDGTVYQTAKVAYGTEISLIAPADKEGYTASWTAEEEYVTMPAKDISYRATYSVIEYTITYYNEDGTVYQTAKVAYGTEISLIAPADKEGYTASWTAEEEYVTMPAKDISYRATYSAIEYTITYYNEDGTVYQTVKVAYGTEISLIVPVSKEGYTASWTAEEEYVTMPAKDISYRATYSIIEYTVTFVADGKTVATVTYTVEDTDIEVPAVPTKDGYTGEWEVYTLTGNVTVNAIYTKTGSEDSSASEDSSVPEDSSFVDGESSKDDTSGGGQSLFGCSGTIGGLSVAMMGIGALVVAMRKKED